MSWNIKIICDIIIIKPFLYKLGAVKRKWMKEILGKIVDSKSYLKVKFKIKILTLMHCLKDLGLSTKIKNILSLWLISKPFLSLSKGGSIFSFIFFRSIRIFKSLADYLVTRNPRQCRSHYQKLMLKFKTINKFRKHYRN